MPHVVSVIIPTYNHAGYVSQTIESVLAQTYPNFEIVVVNDGSPDNTSDVLRPYTNSGKIVYIEQQNAGQAAARNRGLEEASGDFIAFLDDDDLWPPEKLAWQTAILREQPDVIGVGGSIELIDASGDTIERIDLNERVLQIQDLFEGCPFWSPGQTLLRRTALCAVGDFDTTVAGADDYDLYMRLVQVGAFLVCPKLSLRYRVHDGNATNNISRMFNNCQRVTRRYLKTIRVTRERRRCSRSAQRWLFEYLGPRMRARMSTAVRNWDVRDTLRIGSLWVRLAASSVFVDPRLSYDVAFGLWASVRPKNTI